MKAAVCRKIIQFCIVLVIFSVLGVFGREVVLRQETRTGYESYDTEKFFDNLKQLWFTSQDRKDTIIDSALVRAWDGEF